MNTKDQTDHVWSALTEACTAPDADAVVRSSINKLIEVRRLHTKPHVHHDIDRAIDDLRECLKMKSLKGKQDRADTAADYLRPRIQFTLSQANENQTAQVNPCNPPDNPKIT